MTDDLHAMLTGWLASGTEAQRQHAARRLSLPDAIGYQPGPREAYPPLLEQAKSAARAAAGFVASGFATVDEDEQARRLSICISCEHYDPSPGRCRKCGCFSALKARIASEHCPDEPPRW